MARTVHIAAKLAMPPEDAFDAYLNPALHGQITGTPVTIAAKAGAEFKAFDGALMGRILQVEPKRLIVQAWRSSNWKATDIDSTLILMFSKTDAAERRSIWSTSMCRTMISPASAMAGSIIIGDRGEPIWPPVMVRSRHERRRCNFAGPRRR